MRATLTILGLYNYDTSIFENFVVPDDVDSATAVASICMDNAELELMYPEPDTMKFLIGLWSTRMLPVWERVLAAINAEYNPLENYNRTESWTDTEDEDTTNSSSLSNTGSETGSKTTGISETDTGSSTRTPNLTDTHKVVGFNDTAFTNASQDSHTGTEGVSTSTTIANTTTESTTLSTSDSATGSGSGTKDKTTVHSGNVSGNIGVTTSQQMLNQELEVAPKVDIYKYISESFKQRFCLMVY